jgi:hypothetical protein
MSQLQFSSWAGALENEFFTIIVAAGPILLQVQAVFLSFAKLRKP